MSTSFTLSSRIFLLLALVPSTGHAQQVSQVLTRGWRHLDDPSGGPSPNPGLGVVTFTAGQGHSDSIPLYPESEASQPEGYFHFLPDSTGGWTYALAWPDPLVTNLIEFDYESAGLPVDSITPDGRRARVIPGFDAGGRSVRAWVAVRGPGVEILTWRKRLTERDLFFRPGTTPAFFESPEGRPMDFPLGEVGNDYILHPLEVRGPWMRVRAVVASDMCEEPPSPKVSVLWIRYLDESGRPLVWYHTRGC